MLKVLEILPPSQKFKKYKALVIWKGKQQWVHFGDIRYQQYKDRTPLRLYSDLDHGDQERRKKYLMRHKNDSGPAGILARRFLW